ncbi:MAG: hypothetical protein KDA56_04300 [Hyphomonas sp.]|nr:hypothetical protein [Hyphomonas sp.]
MMRRLLNILAVAAWMVLPATGQTCDPSPQRHAVHITSEPPGEDFAEVAGDRSFYQVLDNGWVFALMRAEEGWSLRVFDRAPIGDAVDLTSLTPPLRGAPNPRDIFGWHFRNLDNTGPNTGEVNAPQALRAFVVSPGLQGTAGLRASDGQETSGPDDGIGWLKVIDFGLANPVPGVPASMNWLKFDACLTWPRSQEEAAELIDRASLYHIPEEREEFAACGLDLHAFELSARFAPRTIGGDIDGDGALDSAAQVRRISNGTHGIAICRAGTSLNLLGFETKPDGRVRAGYAGQAEAWQWISPGDELPGHLAGYSLPASDGDILVLERIEKEAVIVFWKDDRMQTDQVYHYVEP